MRDFRIFGGDDFLVAAMPEGALHSVSVKANEDHTQTRFTGHRFIAADDDGDPLANGALPPQTDLVMAEKEIELLVTTAAGEETGLTVEVLGCLPITINNANDNLNGLDWEGESDPVFFAECPVRVTQPDGRVGYGHLERSVRRRLVDRDTFAVKHPQTV